jgi:hypothetical protein
MNLAPQAAVKGVTYNCSGPPIDMFRSVVGVCDISMTLCNIIIQKKKEILLIQNNINNKHL